MRIVAIDTETFPITQYEPVPGLVCASFAELGQVPVLHTNLFEIRDLIFKYQREGWLIVMHNAKFDISVLSRSLQLRIVFEELLHTGMIRCTWIAEALLQLRSGEGANEKKPLGASLKHCASKYKVAELDKENSPRLRYQETATVELDHWPVEFIEYAKLDAVATLGVWQAQRAAAFDYEAFESECIRQLQADYVLQRCSLRGICSSKERIDELESKCMEDVNKHQAVLIEHGILSPKSKRNPTLKRNMSVIKELVEANWPAGAGSLPRTGKGAVMTGKDVLTMCLEHPAIAALKDVTASKKIVESFVPVLRKGEENPWQPKWNVLMRTGRMSCGSKHNTGNLQNQPRKPGVRECWVPRPGNAFVFLDYKAAEMVALAQVCVSWFGHSVLAELINDGVDIHQWLADRIGWIDRQGAKAANFGFPGGLGKSTMVEYAWKGYGVRITLEQADKLKQDWFRALPEMRKYLDRIAAIHSSEFRRDPVKAHKTGRLRGGVTYTTAANCYFQGLVADAIKDACWLTYREHGDIIIAPVHDELVLEIPYDSAFDNTVDSVRRIMATSLKAYCPDVAVHVEVAASDCWYKKAKELRNVQGRLLLDLSYAK